ncbi:MAG: transporter [Halioglobus sp.]
MGLGIGLLFSGLSLAEEGGSGHYFPGSMSSFIDGVPAGETQLIRLNVLNYEGDFDSDVTVPIAGLAALDVAIDSFAIGITGLWRPPVDLGERWSYAAAVTVPFVDLQVAADIGVPSDPQNRSVRRSDSDSGLGDILLFPLMLNYKASAALNYNFRVGLYAPTGEYQTGKLANTGKNYWSVEPTAALVYLNPQNGREISAFIGTTFNQKNDDTNYKSGTQAHMEVTAAQHFPLWGGLAGAGFSGFWYHQLSGDSGSGASFGNFKARARGIGPVVSWTGTLVGFETVAEFKWLHESGVERRPEGDTLFLKAVLKF